MAVKMRKAEQSEATRAALIRAARALFAAKGYAGTPTEEIVTQAGVTRGALYHHFRDKRDLMLSVFRSLEEEFVLRLAQAAASSGPDPWEQLRAGCGHILDACLEPEVRQIVLLDAPAVLGWQTWHEIEVEFGLGLLKVGLQRAMDTGVIEKQPVDLLAHLLFGALGEAAQMIARSEDVNATRDAVGASFDDLLARFRIEQRGSRPGTKRPPARRR